MLGFCKLVAEKIDEVDNYNNIIEFKVVVEYYFCYVGVY